MTLERFIEAQENTYQTALTEIRAGRKKTHWMWFIFPQLKGLGRSSTAEFYGISDLNEAKDYLSHPVLGQRLKEITKALLAQPVRDPHKIFGSPDDLKFQSSLTLFAEADDSQNTVFAEALKEFFKGKRDQQTLKLLKEN